MSSPVPRFAYALALLLAAGYAWVTLGGPNGWQAFQERRAEIRELEKRNATLAQEIERKRDRIWRLGHNDADQELEIRERLKLARPGETVYIFADPAGK